MQMVGHAEAEALPHHDVLQAGRPLQALEQAPDGLQREGGMLAILGT